MLKERIWFIDYAKIIGLYMVIFAHLYTSEGIGADNTVRTFFYGFHMPFFFAISGMLYKVRKEGLKYALLKNVKTLFVPWLIFNLFFILIGIITTDNSPLAVIKSFIICVAKGKGTICGASWFVICLFIIKCIYDILKKTDKMYLAWFIIALTIIPIKLRYFYFASSTIGFAFYFIGNISFKYIKKIELKKLQYIIIAIVCFIISYYITKLNGNISVARASLHNPILFYVNAIIGSIGIISLALSLKNWKNEGIAKISTSSICVVLTHMAFVKYVWIWKNNMQLNDIEMFLFYTIAAVIIYIICYYLYVIINKYAPWVFGRR